jgi:alpha-glucoside transport system substrate-binding protein
MTIVAASGLLLSSVAGRAYAMGQHSSAKAGLGVTIFGQWASAEKTDFQAILSYCDAHYGTKATYQQSSANFATELQTRVQGGNPPDVAALSDPGSVAEYVAGNSLVPISFLQTPKFNKQYSSFWRKLGTVSGKPYILFMKADVKSLVWYSPKKFKAGHYAIPKTWKQLVALSQKMIKKGKQPWAFGVGGSPSSPWTLTDFLENVFLQQNGPVLYQKWINHKIAWTSSFVKKAFQQLGQIVNNNKMIAGGRQRSLSQAWDQAAVQMVNDPKAEFFQEATFVNAGLAGDLPKAKPGRDYNAFAFPTISNRKVSPVEAAPNGVVMFKDTPGSRALMKCLADPLALAQWAKRGGFISPNNATPLSDYPTAFLRTAASEMIKAGKANELVTDASDAMPPALGGNYEFTALQKWFKDPSSLNSVLQGLENEAKKDYKH